VAAILLPGGAVGPPLPLTPGLAARVRRALADLDHDDLETSLETLIGAGSSDGEALLLVVSAEHYADPDVRAAIGYPGPQPIPLPTLPDPADAELDALLHLFMLNRGVLMTPFHMMALMCPTTTEADVDAHTAALAEIAAEIA